MENKPLVSVLMSIYKESVAVVSQAIDSIRKQSYENIEIIALLDDPEHQEMKKYLARIAEEEPRFHYGVNKANIGLLDSLNRGLVLCHGEFVCRMDADDCAETDRIEKQFLYMDRYALDLVGSYTRLMDADGNDLGIIKRFPIHHKYLCKYLKYASAIPHPTWFVRKNVYDELQGYRSVLYAEDYDFLIRSCLSGFRLGVVPEPLLRYRINREGITQQNIASQKIVSGYLALQLTQHRIFAGEDIGFYRQKKKRHEKRLTEYYAAAKKWKTGGSLTFTDKCAFIINKRNAAEFWERLMCRWILYRDGRYGHY